MRAIEKSPGRPMLDSQLFLTELDRRGSWQRQKGGLAHGGWQWPLRGRQGLLPVTSRLESLRLASSMWTVSPDLVRPCGPARLEEERGGQ